MHLEFKQRFGSYKDRIERYVFTDGVNYVSAIEDKQDVALKNPPSKFTIDIAREESIMLVLDMLENNEKG